ncbi:SmE [Symbiodinium natans]|uniref:SmE protein n=1 Tax=Symbiodinium natans TaxID=878477 RepID=A0A812JKX3_9DINO|nr:SmE [Symbiodinium natans]
MKLWHRGFLVGCLATLLGAVKRPNLRLGPDVRPGDGPGFGHSHTLISLLETHSALSDEVKSDIQDLFSAVSAQSIPDVRQFDRYISSLATALVSLSEKVGAPYLQDPLSQILKVIDKTLKPGILDQHAATEQAIARADQGVLDCYHTLWRGLNASNAIRDSLAGKSQAIKSCYSSVAAASDGVAAALVSLPRLLSTRASDCENLLAASDVSKAPLQAWATSCDHHDSPSVGTYLMKQLMHWEELLQQYDDTEKRCKESTQSYETQVVRYNSMKSRQSDGADCRPLQADMDAAACKQALDRIESCQTYSSCMNESIGDRRALHASQCKVEVTLKAQWYALESMKCLLEAYEDHGGSEDLVSRFATCKSRDPESYKLQFLSLRGCHAVEADLADALASANANSTTSRECAVTKEPQNDPSLAGTAAYAATYYRGFEATKCTAKCCSQPPYVTSTTTTTSTTTVSTTTTSTAVCNATTVNMERTKQGSCTKLTDGRPRWVAGLSPAPGTPEEALKEFGLALAIKSAKVMNTSKLETPETEIPHVVMDADKKLTVYFKHPGSCDEQRRVLEKVLPAGRSIKMHRCRGTDDYFV